MDIRYAGQALDPAIGPTDQIMRAGYGEELARALRLLQGRAIEMEDPSGAIRFDPRSGRIGFDKGNFSVTVDPMDKGVRVGYTSRSPYGVVPEEEEAGRAFIGVNPLTGSQLVTDEFGYVQRVPRGEIAPTGQARTARTLSPEESVSAALAELRRGI